MITAAEKSAFQCIDCSVSTFDNDEYYMIHDHVWLSVVERRDSGMLCIGCLEGRLKRPLTPSDFTGAPINHLDFCEQSERLRDRLGFRDMEIAA